MLRRLIVAGFAFVTVLSSAGQSPAQVSVSIGINLPAPPPLVVIPASPIQYAPSVDANYFFYGGEYFVFVNGAWHVSAGFNGPWVVLAPEFIPQPLLLVPVRFYRRQPEAWRAWRHDAPPQWAPAWGRRWEERRRDEGQAQPRFERRDDRRDDVRERREERRNERRDDRRDDRRGDRHDGRR